MTVENKREYFECTCFSEEHTLICTLMDLGPDWNPELEFSIFLKQYTKYINIPYMPYVLNDILNTLIITPAFRIWTAIKYIFGYKSQYGDFDCFSMKPENVDKFIELLQVYKKLYYKRRNDLNTLKSIENDISNEN